MFYKIRSFAVASLVMVMLTACNLQPVAPAPPAPANERRPGFPDFGHMPDPITYHKLYGDKPVFKLSQNYPQTKPAANSKASVFNIAFDGDKWLDYAVAVRDYCFAGNIEHDWRPELNTVRKWYHIPWLHWGPGGTEGFHGLIREASVGPNQLSAGQTGTFQIYAVTVINDFGGYAMGQLWKDPSYPNRQGMQAPNGGFPPGTIICKLLFTTATPNQVDYLVNPIEWDAFITPTFTDTRRIISKVRLIQMDWMVRDERSKETGWVFGTFAYNGALKNANPWYNLVPVGLMWGNDPQNTTNLVTLYPATKTFINPELKQTRINPSPDLPPQHLGWNGRLNGPADLNTSSCMSCHSVAEYPQLTNLVLFPGMVPPPTTTTPALGGTKEWMIWFQNIRAATPIDKEATSTDYSLQVQMSIANFWDWKDGSKGGCWDEEFGGAKAFRVQRGGFTAANATPNPNATLPTCVSIQQ